MAQTPRVSSALLKVRVKTGAKADTVTQVKDIFRMEVRAAARENRANRRIRELMARHLKVPVDAIRIVKGHHSPSKVLQVFT